MRLSRHPILPRVVLIGVAALGLQSAAWARPTLNIGSKRFTESYVLGEIIRQLAARTGEVRAVHKAGLGNTGIVFAALQSGSIDIYPEYTGTLSQEILKNPSMVSLDRMNDELRPMGLAASVPLGFNDTYALAMREDTAQKLNIRSMSDLAAHTGLKYALSQEFLNRADGWPGVKSTYGLAATAQGIDHGLAYEAIAGGQIDVTDIYSTDAKIAKYRLRVLDDDRNYFPHYDAVLLYRLDLPARFPRTWAAIQRLSGKITGARMVQMNAAVELQHETYGHVATGFLARDLKMGRPPVEVATGWLEQAFGDHFWLMTGQHLFLVFVSLLGAVVIGIPLGVAAARSNTLAQPILGFVGVVQTIPSLALLVVLIPILHQIGDAPTLIALFLYSLLPIVRNTYSGLIDIPPPLRESAQALGLPNIARIRLIELPMASRSILSGIKTSAVLNVGTATIAAFIGAGGYGELIVTGLSSDDDVKLVGGAIAVGVMALLIQGAFDLLDRWVVPKGLRLGT